jgi:hypothetical protein
MEYSRTHSRMGRQVEAGTLLAARLSCCQRPGLKHSSACPPRLIPASSMQPARQLCQQGASGSVRVAAAASTGAGAASAAAGTAAPGGAAPRLLSTFNRPLDDELTRVEVLQQAVMAAPPGALAIPDADGAAPTTGRPGSAQPKAHGSRPHT